MPKYLEDMEEAFFERYFEYGDDAETAEKNAKKAYQVMMTAYKKAEGIEAAARDGEVFDENEAITVFQTLALAKNAFEQFLKDVPEEAARILAKAFGEVVKQ